METLCFFTRVLGWRVFGQYVKGALDQAIRYDLIEYGGPETWAVPTPRFLGISMDLDCWWRARGLLKTVPVDQYSQIIVQAHQLLLPLLGAKCHIVAIIDTTPRMAHTSNRETGVRRALKSLFVRLMHPIYKRAFGQTNQFLVLSSRVRESLVADYQVPSSRIQVLHPPVLRESARKVPNAKPVLLFIGNNFYRKGGDFLLELYGRHLKGSAELIVVSNDPRMEQIELPAGVIHKKNIPHEEIFDLFAEADLFLFPTWKDELGLVLSEALSVGLPIIARDAGAQGEFVKDGVNGRLMPYDSNIEDWAEAIKQSLPILETYRRNSIELSRQLLDPAIFNGKVIHALEAV